jgi:Holliday junction resolvase RusA-like endonuclease
MRKISFRINGVPYCWSKKKGNIRAPRGWTRAIIKQTKRLPKVEKEQACILKATFLLPPNKYPKDFPYGPDLDNLMKRLMDALCDTIFKNAKGKDSCVVEMNVKKKDVKSEKKAGVLIQLFPIIIR